MTAEALHLPRAGVDAVNTQPKFKTPEILMREEAAYALCDAIADCHPGDAAQIIAAALEYLGAGDPPIPDPFGDLRADAEFWADCANPPELAAYFSSALVRLGNRALAIKARKQLFVALWFSFPLEERMAFLSRVDAQGQFLAGGSA